VEPTEAQIVVDDEEKVMDEDVIITTEVLKEAKEELNSVGGDHVQRLAMTLCILLDGFLDKLIEEQSR
jgi:hypothetical protein